MRDERCEQSRKQEMGNKPADKVVLDEDEDCDEQIVGYHRECKEMRHKIQDKAGRGEVRGLMRLRSSCPGSVAAVSDAANDD
jgi:hypothetical protein